MHWCRAASRACSPPLRSLPPSRSTQQLQASCCRARHHAGLHGPRSQTPDLPILSLNSFWNLPAPLIKLHCLRPPAFPLPKYQLVFLPQIHPTPAAKPLALVAPVAGPFGGTSHSLPGLVGEPSSMGAGHCAFCQLHLPLPVGFHFTLQQQQTAPRLGNTRFFSVPTTSFPVSHPHQ